MKVNLKYVISLAVFAVTVLLTIVIISSCRSSNNTVADGIEYTLLESGKAYEITGVSDLTKTEFTIPAEINELPVRGIGASAFAGNENVKTLKISGGLSYIADSAFSGCKSLEGITLPLTLTRIGSRAFEKCEALNYVDLGGTMHIGDYAFAESNALKEINIPDDTVSLGESAFRDCLKLERVKIGLGLTEIKSHTFAGCCALISVKLHDDIKTVGESAFRDCLELSEVWLGYGLDSIGTSAFLGCERLKYVYFTNFESWNVEEANGISFKKHDLTDPALAADYLSISFANGAWKRAK